MKPLRILLPALLLFMAAGNAVAQKLDANTPHYWTWRHYSADVDWCIRCMKRSDEMFNTHLILVNYLREGTSTRNRRASLKERFHIMCKYYGTLPTVLRHIGFAVRFGIAKIRGVE